MPYPIFLRLEGKEALVIGAGAVGRRKVAGLSGRGLARVLVLDPALSDGSETLHGGTRVEYQSRGFVPEDATGKALVFVCTNNRVCNARAAEACRERGVLCNVADAPEESDFFVPALAEHGDICLAVGTGGAGPALSRRIREELEAWLGNRYTALAALLRRLRPRLLALGLGATENTRIFRALVRSCLAEQLADNDFPGAEASLREQLPPSLHASIGDLLHER